MLTSLEKGPRKGTGRLGKAEGDDKEKKCDVCRDGEVNGLRI